MRGLQVARKLMLDSEVEAPAQVPVGKPGTDGTFSRFLAERDGSS
jgi:hypothetical protein